MNKDFANSIYDGVRERLAYLAAHPEEVTDDVKDNLMSIYNKLCKALGVSEHSAWGVKWTIEKRDKANAPILETVTGNIILNGGANEMLKLVFGVGSPTAYDASHARIVVGSDSTAERADQTGVIALGSNKADSALDGGYPKVDGRTATVRATFGEGVANFPWNEVSLVNGQGSAVALNRKQTNMGTKSGGVWTVQLEVSIVEVA